MLIAACLCRTERSIVILYISFTTRPGTGSEGGVGWQFLKAHAKYAQATGQELVALIDQRDQQEVARALAAIPEMSSVGVTAVALPSLCLRLWGDRRTRLSYLVWYMRARVRARELASSLDVDVVHQATFATASLPPVMPRSVPVKVWGPVAIPENVVEQSAMRALIEAAGIVVLRILARILSKRPTVTLAQNDSTYTRLRSWGRRVVLEPNIVVADDAHIDESRCPDTPYFVMCGLLIERKRPWVALESFSSPEFREMELIVVGSGPLEQELKQRYAGSHSNSGVVKFLGKVPHHEAIGLLKNAAALLHPAKREGAPWAVGEAVSFGTPVVLLGESGASAVLRLSGGEGIVVPENTSETRQIEIYREAMRNYLAGCCGSRPRASNPRWNEARLPHLLSEVISDAADAVRTQ